MSAPLPPNESRGSGLIISQWVTVSIASLLVFLRIYARAFYRKIAGADDWTIVIALAFAIAQSILTIFQVANGFGRHIAYIEPPHTNGNDGDDRVRTILLLTTITEILHTIGTLLVRVSVCLSVLRLMPAPTHRGFRTYTYVLVAFFAVVSVATCLLILLGCVPVRGAWDRAVEAKCVPRSTVSIIAKTQGALSAVMDLLCVGLPIFVLRNLQARLGQKVALFVLLGLGLFTAACAILRTLDINFRTEDFTWNKAPVAFWAALEQNIGIIAASVPAVYQLHTSVLQRFFPNIANKYPKLRSLNIYTSSDDADDTRNGSQNEKALLNGRGSQSGRLMSNAADRRSNGGGGTILPGPPSPTKKEPRLDYDSATLSSSPKLEQAATHEELSYLK